MFLLYFFREFDEDFLVLCGEVKIWGLGGNVSLLYVWVWCIVFVGLIGDKLYRNLNMGEFCVFKFIVLRFVLCVNL